MTRQTVSPWPADLRPEGAPAYTWNDLEIRADMARVWAHLIRARDWSQFYANCADLRFENADGPDLALGTRFRWRTFGVRVRTTVEVFEPPRCLAWRGDEVYGRGFHAWVLQPTTEGCRVITEEVQRGLLPWVGRWYLRAGLLKWHQRWLTGLAARAEAGPPGHSPPG